jgi:hypothetical protein
VKISKCNNIDIEVMCCSDKGYNFFTRLVFLTFKSNTLQSETTGVQAGADLDQRGGGVKN